MDLSGRGPAYRGVTIRCPGCGEAMRAEPVPSAEVDVCDACGALWIDWFDGDIATLATEAEAARVERFQRSLAGMTPNQNRNQKQSPNKAPGQQQHGIGACPRCMRALAPELYRFSDATEDELVNGVELLRCSECAGSFVPRPSAHLLLDRVREPRPLTLWEALVALLQRLVAPSPHP